MNENTGEHDEQHPPRWVPYTPPPPDGWDRVRLLFRRLSFPLLAGLFVLGIAGAVYWSTVGPPEERAAAGVTVAPSSGLTERGTEEAGAAELTVRSTPLGATVRINGDSIGTTPLGPRPLRSGVYMLSVRAKGYFRADTVVVLSEGTGPTVRLSLRPRPGTEDAAASASTPSPPIAEPRADRPLPVTSTPAAADEPPTPAVPAYGGLYVTSAPPGAVVTMDGTERGRTPLSVAQVPPGSKRLSVSLDGYESWGTQVEIRPDSIRRVHAALRARTGRLRVLARPWGTIYVDGALHARESDVWYETELPAGLHRVTVVHPALGQRVQEVEVRAGEEASVVFNLTDPEGGTP